MLFAVWQLVPVSFFHSPLCMKVGENIGDWWVFFTFFSGTTYWASKAMWVDNQSTFWFWFALQFMLNSSSLFHSCAFEHIFMDGTINWLWQCEDCMGNSWFMVLMIFCGCFEPISTSGETEYSLSRCYYSTCDRANVRPCRNQSAEECVVVLLAAFLSLARFYM